MCVYFCQQGPLEFGRHLIAMSYKYLCGNSIATLAIKWVHDSINKDLGSDLSTNVSF